MRVPDWWPINWWPFCAHRSWSWAGNVYGDTIGIVGNNRSCWCCDECGLQRFRPYLAGPNYGDGDGYTLHSYTDVM